MPTYDYQCSKCGYIFEAFQSIVAEPLTVCPNCQEPELRRMINGGAGLIFKGSGFYLTDYKNSHSAPSTATNDTAGKTPEKKEDEH